MREAPSLVLIKQLLEMGAKVRVYDPVAIDEAQRILGNVIVYSKDMYEATIGADAIAVVTEWNEFRLPNYKVLNKLMNQKLVFDGRNIFEPEELNENGFTYFSIGRKNTLIKKSKSVTV